MPVTIEELNTTFDVHDDAKIRQLVRQEIQAELSALRRGSSKSRDTSAADPAAGSNSSEGRGM